MNFRVKIDKKLVFLENIEHSWSFQEKIDKTWKLE